MLTNDSLIEVAKIGQLNKAVSERKGIGDIKIKIKHRGRRYLGHFLKERKTISYEDL